MRCCVFDVDTSCQRRDDCQKARARRLLLLLTRFRGRISADAIIITRFRWLYNYESLTVRLEVERELTRRNSDQVGNSIG